MSSLRVLIGFIFAVLYMLIGGLFFISVVRADSFYPSGEILNCHFVPAVAIGIRSLPTIGIFYDRGEIVGESEATLQNYRLTDLVNIRRGQVRRYNKAVSVSVVPGARVVLYGYGYNFAGHSVKVRDFWIPTQIPGYLDFSDLLRLWTYRQNLKILYGGVYRYRTERFWITSPNKWFADRENSQGFLLSSFEVKRPVALRIEEPECGVKTDGTVFFRAHFCIKNVSGFKLRGAIRDGSSRVAEVNVSANAKQCVLVERIYSDPYLQMTSLDDIYFDDYGGYTACGAITSSDRGDNTDMMTRGVFVSRSDTHPGWFGKQPGFAVVESNRRPWLCVKIVPYSLKFHPISCRLQRKAIVKVKRLTPEKVSAGEDLRFKISVTNVGVGIRSGVLKVCIDRFWAYKVLWKVSGSPYIRSHCRDVYITNFRYGDKREYQVQVRFPKPVEDFPSENSVFTVSAEYLRERSSDSVKLLKDVNLNVSGTSYCVGEIPYVKLSYRATGNLKLDGVKLFGINPHNLRIYAPGCQFGGEVLTCSTASSNLVFRQEGPSVVGLGLNICAYWGNLKKCKQMDVYRDCSVGSLSLPHLTDVEVNFPPASGQGSQFPVSQISAYNGPGGALYSAPPAGGKAGLREVAVWADNTKAASSAVRGQGSLFRVIPYVLGTNDARFKRKVSQGFHTIILKWITALKNFIGLLFLFIGFVTLAVYLKRTYNQS